ncbi:hypothetical protein llap_14476 [Limosa lapponica baueri]|uniref:FH2 domain-containing protein n=1 Tax=Limosa lapponica baueri TaxID=1758121 RepID=A0A2I0TN53_LIMLA|nr:hypothetical protein llap_14476 [Limosa lapponica baueri]
MDNTRTQDTFSQLSQEKILKIMNMVKNKEVSIEGALHLAQKEVYAEKDPQDLLTGSQFNFSIYKYKHYRWQKRILQIDFNTKTIFNIEKGIIKKQFPFSQVKACEDTERRRFSIVFHGRQDYELEAVSLDDKRKNTLINQPHLEERVEEKKGLIELYLVQLREGELTLYCIGLGGKNKTADPVTNTINLSGGNVSVSKENGCSTFSVQTKEHNYLFRIPFTVQRNCTEDFSKLQNEWVSLIERYCQLCKGASLSQEGSQGCTSSEADYEDFAVPLNEQKEETLHFGVSSATTSMKKSSSPQPAEEDAAPASPSLPLPISKAEVPPAPPALPQPCSLSPLTKRTKAFHWDIVPCDKMCKIPHLSQRLDLLLTVRELPVSMRDLEPLINQKIQASKQLQSSQKFVAVLEYVLAIGNHLNEKAGKEKAKGFRLSSLTKYDSSVCQLLLYSKELTEFEAVPDASMKGLIAEVDVLKKELENVIQCRRLIKPKTIKATPRESQFSKELKDLIQKYEGDLSQLSKRCDEMKKLYSNILVKFGEPQDVDSQELFGWVSSFISEFRKACAEVMP